MDIGPVNNRVLRQQPNGSSPEKTVNESKPPAKDTVEISLAARRKLADLADKALSAETDSANVERGKVDDKTTGSIQPTKATSLDEVRARIESGFYDQPEVKDKIAKNLSDEFES